MGSKKEKYSQVTLFVFLLLVNSTLGAQVTIGSSKEPNKGALLDLKENDNVGQNSTRGLLLPRVGLIQRTSLSPILSDESASDEDQKRHIGLMVFNMTDNYAAELCHGIYVWASENWTRLGRPCCYQLEEVVIANPTLSFDDGDTAVFEAMIRNPFNILDPYLEYEWYLDEVVVKSRSAERTFTLPMSMSLDGKQLSVKAYNYCSEKASVSRAISVVTTCVPLQDVIIENFLLRDNFNFPVGKTVDFYALVAPEDASNLSFEWTFGDDDPEQLMNIFRKMEDADNGKVLKLEVSNDCSSITREVTIKTYVTLCPSEDKDKINVTSSSDKKQLTFDLYGLALYYSEEDLDALGVNNQWYKKQKNISGGGLVDAEFVPIPGATHVKYNFLTSEYFGGDQDECNIGVIVTGADNIMDCPFNNSRRFSYKIRSKELNGSYYGVISVDNNPW